MSQKRVKQYRRMARRYNADIVRESIEQTIREPFFPRIQTAAYIASGGRWWVVKAVRWFMYALAVAFVIFSMKRLSQRQ